MSQFDLLETVNTDIQRQVQTVLLQCLEKLLGEKVAKMREALLQTGWKPEDLSTEDIPASILAEFLEGIYKAEEHFLTTLRDLGYDG